MGLCPDELRAALRAGQLAWRRHALERMASRGIPQAAVIEALTRGELIEEYPDDVPYPSALFLGSVQGQLLHVVAALDGATGWAYVITAYCPDPAVFETDHRTRRRRR